VLASRDGVLTLRRFRSVKKVDSSVQFFPPKKHVVLFWSLSLLEGFASRLFVIFSPEGPWPLGRTLLRYPFPSGGVLAAIEYS